MRTFDPRLPLPPEHPRPPRQFPADERGAVSTDFVVTFAAVLVMAMLVGSQVVVPLVEVAYAQSQLNEESIRIIEAAAATCPGSA